MTFLAWRFAYPRDEFKALFEEVVRSGPEKTKWEFRPGEKNWMIVPVRLIEESGPDTEHFNEAVASISKNDQAFCADTAVDLESILNALAKASDRLPERPTRSADSSED
ncbi:hypothetical protein [Streptomyces sp. NPDC051921]|uniref:hypothetical protein n=1 Tax=Streptomyces sp. NPDC051921 TaxID=3155806 RepID=UPI003434BCEC